MWLYLAMLLGALRGSLRSHLRARGNFAVTSKTNGFYRPAASAVKSFWAGS